MLIHGYFFYRIQFLKNNFNRNGGSFVYRNACHEIKNRLLESPYNVISFAKLNLPSKHPLHKLRPQNISLQRYKNEKNVDASIYIIGITGGVYHTGYLIFDSTDNLPKKVTYGPN